MKSQNPVSESNIVPSVDIDAPLQFDEAKDLDVDKDYENQTSKFYFGIGFFCLIFLVTTLIIIFSGSVTSLQPNQVSPTPSTISDLTLNVVDKIAPSTWTVEVLNGSGIPGKAKIVSDRLKANGFIVLPPGNYSGVVKGNQIFVTTALLDQKDLFVKEASNVVDGAIYSGILTDSTASARIILGK